MFDRILQTFALFNDSDAFDCSFEIKQITEIGANQVKEKSATNEQQLILNKKTIPTLDIHSPNNLKSQCNSSLESSMLNQRCTSASTSDYGSPILSKSCSEFKLIKSCSFQDLSFTRSSSVKKVEKATSVTSSIDNEESEEHLVLHPPLVPIYKLTPTKQSRTFYHSGYHRSVGDIAKFLQSSFYAKQARISRLIRTNSNKFKNDKMAMLKKCHFNDVTNTRFYTTTNDHVSNILESSL